MSARMLERADEAQLRWRATVEAAVEAVSPQARTLELDREKRFDEALQRRLGEIGVYGCGTPEAEGGSGGDTVHQAIALEVLGRKATSMAVYCVVSFLVTRLLRHHGSPEQQRTLLRPLLKGQLQAAFCLTESGGGTDVLANTHTVARPQGNDWVIDGDKTWVSGATDSDVLLVVARTAEHRTRGFTVFAVPAGTPGVSTSRLDTMALNSLPSCEVRLQGVVVPHTAVVGEVNDGLKQIMAALNGERINAAAVVNGVGRGALEAALDHARSRQAFAKPIGQFQAVQHRLAASAVAIETAWSSVLEAARRDAAGEATDVLSAMAKWASSKAALGITDVGMELMAAAGFLEQQVMQRLFRDARLHVFAPVNNDMILNLLGERWLGLPRAY
ncbi:MAG: acyl-CoA dehydrogenase family protein [Burkholderiales bacterium]